MLKYWLPGLILVVGYVVLWVWLRWDSERHAWTRGESKVLTIAHNDRFAVGDVVWFGYRRWLVTKAEPTRLHVVEMLELPRRTRRR